MSEYRDDMQDTAVASDSVFIRLYTTVDDGARAGDRVFVGIGFVVDDAAIAGDKVVDKTLATVTDRAVAGDQVLQALHAANLVTEQAIAGDRVLDVLRSLVEDGAIASDAVLDSALTLITDTAMAGDEVISQRSVVQLVADSAKASDQAFVIFSNVVDDGAVAGDMVLGSARIATLVQDSAVAGDEVLSEVRSAVYLVVDRATAADEVIDRLHAVQLVVDAAMAYDEAVMPGQLLGQVWTANAGNWAMSRWAPFGVTGLAVVDGVMYATTPDGVYALDGADEQMQAEVRTGLIDMTGQALGLPVESHIEYELAGTAYMDVTQTQTGQRKTYPYPLKGRPQADALTNARFEFGRGLRGRHFAYTLRLMGTSAHINDWTVLAPASKRSL
ncbi:hypothetical protein ACFIQF_22595 [Comamonas sp. J-3]|uniref:hypothetical protein n=1 Tax=Comamonas trifloxystrobinivorans TaxID=3350256 RepID=UPI0037286883